MFLTIKERSLGEFLLVASRHKCECLFKSLFGISPMQLNKFICSIIKQVKHFVIDSV